MSNYGEYVLDLSNETIKYAQAGALMKLEINDLELCKNIENAILNNKIIKLIIKVLSPQTNKYLPTTFTFKETTIINGKPLAITTVELVNFDILPIEGEQFVTIGGYTYKVILTDKSMFTSEEGDIPLGYVLYASIITTD